MIVGVFDSGIGGLSVAQAIERALPQLNVIYRHDTPDHFPYATRTPDEIYTFVFPILASLVTDGCEVIVVACNTVSTTIIDQLRENVTVPLIPVEPMLQKAAQVSKTGIIAVYATPTTLRSHRYNELKRAYASHCQVYEPDCADWSTLIEHNAMNEQRLSREVEPALAGGADVIVLGCTHYHWVEEDICRLAGDRALVIQPEDTIVQELKRVIARLA